jgi:hypothetical protein
MGTIVVSLPDDLPPAPGRLNGAAQVESIKEV